MRFGQKRYKTYLKQIRCSACSHIEMADIYTKNVYMQEYNYNIEEYIINGLKKNQTVYKYVKFKHLVWTLKNRKIKLLNTTYWEKDDCNENFIMNHDYECRNGAIMTLEDHKRDSFGQSWTLKKESDAMWRIYSGKIIPNTYNFSNVAVKIQTKVSKLIDLYFPKSISNPFNECAFVGKVCYCKDEEIRQWICDNIDKIPGKSYDKMFFLKRKPFDFEKEVRIIYDTNKSSLKDNEEIKRVKTVKNFHIDPNVVFDRYILDPRLSLSQYETIKNELVGLGVLPERIHKSELHDFAFPQVVINL